MDHLRIMGFLVLLFTTLSALQFADARVLEHHFDNAALSHQNSAVIFDSDLDAVAVASSRQNYSGSGGHVANYSESNPGSNSEISSHADNNTIIAAELSKKEATPGDGSSAKAPAGIKEVAPVKVSADILHEMLNSHSSPGVGHVSVNNAMEGNIFSSSGKSPGVGHWEKSTTTYSATSPARTTPNNVLSSGPSPGVGNSYTSDIGGSQSELGTFNRLPSGSSPGVGHKVTNAYTEMSQDLESKKSAKTMNILLSGPSPGVGNSATNGRNMMEKISIESESMKKTESKKKNAMRMNILSSGHVSFNNGIEGNILSSGQSPGVGHWEKSTTTYSATSPARTIPNNVLSSGPSPGVGNAHTSGIAGTESELGTFNKLPSGPSPGVGNGHTNGIAGTQSELDTFNKLPSGPSPGVGHKVTNGYTEMAQESESKKSATMMNILPSGQSPGVGHSATNGRNMMEKISIQPESMKKAEITQDSQSKKKSAMRMNILSSGPSPGVGNSATNGRNAMEKIGKEKDEKGMSIKTFNRLPSGSSPGEGHSYTNANQPEKLERASKDRKDSDDTPIFEKLPGGPSPGGGHSYVQKSASTMRMQLSSNALRKTSSSPSPGDRTSSKNKAKAARSEKKKVEKISGVPDWNIGCDGGGLDSYGTPTPPMFGIATAGS